MSRGFAAHKAIRRHQAKLQKHNSGVAGSPTPLSINAKALKETEIIILISGTVITLVHPQSQSKESFTESSFGQCVWLFKETNYPRSPLPFNTRCVPGN